MFFTQECIEHRLIPSEWTLAKELITILEPLYLATMELNGEKFTSISKIIPLTQRLMDIYIEDNEDPELNTNVLISERLKTPGLKLKITTKKVNHISTDLKQKIGTNLYERFGDADKNKKFLVATLLDPRFKQLGFDSEEVILFLLYFMGAYILNMSKMFIQYKCCHSFIFCRVLHLLSNTQHWMPFKRQVKMLSLLPKMIAQN